MVFFRGSVALRAGDEAPQGPCSVYPDGRVEYLCPRPTAEAIDQTLTAVVFIRQTLAERGLAVVPLGAASQSFIAGWEAEAARRKLMSK